MWNVTNEMVDILKWLKKLVSRVLALFFDDVEKMCSSLRGRSIPQVLTCAWCRLRKPRGWRTTQAVRAREYLYFDGPYIFIFLFFFVFYQNINFDLSFGRSCRIQGRLDSEAARPFES